MLLPAATHWTNREVGWNTGLLLEPQAEWIALNGRECKVLFPSWKNPLDYDPLITTTVPGTWCACSVSTKRVYSFILHTSFWEAVYSSPARKANHPDRSFWFWTDFLPKRASLLNYLRFQFTANNAQAKANRIVLLGAWICIIIHVHYHKHPRLLDSGNRNGIFRTCFTWT